MLEHRVYGTKLNQVQTNAIVVACVEECQNLNPGSLGA
jgi:hypothetical protein